jgi:mono/diheme cytochrome c family protein
MWLLAFSITASGEPAKTKEPGVTAVEGESWISHLNRSFDETAMGKTGRIGPPVTAQVKSEARKQAGLPVGPGPAAVLLRGSDLYRFDCQGCHQENGLGAPPEINSVINPVRSTSSAAISEQMKERGKRAGIDMAISPADAAALAKQSQGALLQRLHKGGQSMPPFSHLREAEIRTLESYLESLAAVPGSQRQQNPLHSSSLRVGELIVRSTCHICHNAAGPNPDPQAIMMGAIPPLSTLTRRTTMQQFVEKITQGSAISMGHEPAPYRGRMPVFAYLTEQEAADAYMYLTLYPPKR